MENIRTNNVNTKTRTHARIVSVLYSSTAHIDWCVADSTSYAIFISPSALPKHVIHGNGGTHLTKQRWIKTEPFFIHENYCNDFNTFHDTRQARQCFSKMRTLLQRGRERTTKYRNAKTRHCVTDFSQKSIYHSAHNSGGSHFPPKNWVLCWGHYNHKAGKLSFHMV